MKQERAIAIGQKALIWIADDPSLLNAFMTETGLAPADVRTRASEPAFLGFVLAFVLGSDASVLAFADAADLLPEEPARARAALGGSEPNWT